MEAAWDTPVTGSPGASHPASLSHPGCCGPLLHSYGWRMLSLEACHRESVGACQGPWEWAIEKETGKTAGLGKGAYVGMKEKQAEGWPPRQMQRGRSAASDAAASGSPPLRGLYRSEADGALPWHRRRDRHMAAVMAQTPTAPASCRGHLALVPKAGLAQPQPSLRLLHSGE